MNVLILVQATHLAPWDQLIEAQKQTWDAVNVPGMDTIYFYSHPTKSFYEGKNLYVKCSGEHGMEHWRMKLAFDHILDGFASYEYVFRTNASSYINKALLLDFLKDKPKEKYYCGIDGGGFASGCGYIMTMDCVKIIQDQFDDYPSESEDCLTGVYMQRNGISVSPGAQRIEFNHYSIAPEKECYHYRCKSDNADRTKDINAFNKLFKQFNS